MEARKNLVALRLSDEELADLDALKGEVGRDRSDVLRRLVARAVGKEKAA